MTAPKNAPYAPPKNILHVISRARNQGIPDPLTLKGLEAISIPAGNTSRVLQALRFLGLIDDAGRPTEAFQRLQLARSDEYPQVLAEIIRAAYHEVLTIADPSADSITAITDAFRQYQPSAQRGRMVTLLLGLCTEAGIGPAAPLRGPKPRIPRNQARSQAPRRPTPIKPTPPAPQREGQRAMGAELPDYTLLTGFLQRLPINGRWTREQRDRWLQAMTATLDLVVATEEEGNT